MKKFFVVVILIIIVVFSFKMLRKDSEKKDSEKEGFETEKQEEQLSFNLKEGKYVTEKDNNYIELKPDGVFEQSFIKDNKMVVYNGKYEVSEYEFIIYLYSKSIYNIDKNNKIKGEAIEKVDYNGDDVYDRYEILDDKSIKQVEASGNIDNLVMKEYLYILSGE